MLLLNLLYLKAQHHEKSSFAQDVMKMYHDLWQLNERTTNTKYNQIHIAFGDSVAGSLKASFRNEKIGVLSISDQLHYGPIQQLHKIEGLSRRKEWLWNHINVDDEFLEEYEERMERTIQKIQTIPEEIPITIWTSENAFEQTGLIFVLWLLKGSSHQIKIINTNKVFHERFSIVDPEGIYPLYTGEITPEKLKELFQANMNCTLSSSERDKLERTWIALGNSEDYLRIYQQGEIRNVREDYYDEVIILAAKRISNPLIDEGFIKCARLIGEVMETTNEYMSPEFLEYRIRKLLLEGIFSIRGVPKSMMSYSVKLK